MSEARLDAAAFTLAGLRAAHAAGGRGRFTMGAGPDADDSPVGPGDVIYVAKGVPHGFHEIAEELTLLVLLAPAEG